MKKEIKNSHLHSSDIIKASEIGQYQFCSISWKLQKNGYIPNSPYIKKGEKNHISHGKLIYYINNILKKSKILNLIGYLLLIFALLIIFFEVIF